MLNIIKKYARAFKRGDGNVKILNNLRRVYKRWRVASFTYKYRSSLSSNSPLSSPLFHLLSSFFHLLSSFCSLLLCKSFVFSFKSFVLLILQFYLLFFLTFLYFYFSIVLIFLTYKSIFIIVNPFCWFHFFIGCVFQFYLFILEQFF